MEDGSKGIHPRPASGVTILPSSSDLSQRVHSRPIFAPLTAASPTIITEGGSSPRRTTTIHPDSIWVVWLRGDGGGGGRRRRRWWWRSRGQHQIAAGCVCGPLLQGMQRMGDNDGPERFKDGSTGRHPRARGVT